MKPTFDIGPGPVQRATAVLHYEEENLHLLGEGPWQHIRLQLRGVYRPRYLDRVVTLFAVRELSLAGGTLHWRDVERAFRALNARNRQRIWSEEEFAARLTPALAVGVLTCAWDESWPAAA